MSLKPPEKAPYGLCSAISWQQKEEWLSQSEMDAHIASGRDVEVIPPLRRTDGRIYCRVWVRRVN